MVDAAATKAAALGMSLDDIISASRGAPVSGRGRGRGRGRGGSRDASGSGGLGVFAGVRKLGGADGKPRVLVVQVCIRERERERDEDGGARGGGQDAK